MKLIYVLIALAITVSVSGCIDKAETSLPDGTSATPEQTSVSPGPTDTGNPAGSANSPATTGSDDISGAEFNLTSIDTALNDTNMEVSLLDAI